MKRKPKNYWTFEKIAEEALKHKYRNEFSKSSYQAYDKARVNGWLDIVCTHMEYKSKPRNYWTYEKCYTESLKYTRKIDFEIGCQVAYKKALKNNWMDSICSHMVEIKKPNGYWTLDKCKEEALKYEKIKDFATNVSNVYKVSCKNGWIEEVTAHMDRLTIWSYDKCKTEALKFSSLYNFRKKSTSCYSHIHRNGWLDLLCAHMKRKCNKKGYLTKDICREEAIKYETKKDFRENCENIYNFICRNKWLDELCSHQIGVKKPKGYWTKENCQKESLKYQNLTDFKKFAPSAVTKSRQGGWLKDICKHMDILGSLHKRFIYAYEFPDNHVYVGLTYNIEKRDKGHKIKGSVFNYSEKTKLLPLLKSLTPTPIDVSDAKIMEETFLQEYIENDWIPLNKVKTGAIGKTKIKWTLIKLSEEALKYTCKKDFRKFSSSAYTIAKSKKILDSICTHMNLKSRKPSNYWCYETCKEKALEYTSKRDFRIYSASAYDIAKKNNWLEEICVHMSNGYITEYTIEEFKKIALSYSTIKHFNEENSTCYKTICKNKWNDYVFSHMKRYVRSSK